MNDPQPEPDILINRIALAILLESFAADPAKCHKDNAAMAGIIAKRLKRGSKLRTVENEENPELPGSKIEPKPGPEKI